MDRTGPEVSLLNGRPGLAAGSGFSRMPVVLATAVMVVMALASTDAAADDDAEFSDMSDAGVQAPAVEILDALGIIDGTECASGLFCPDEPMQRWVMAVWLARSLGFEDSNAAASGVFSDVDDNRWWVGHVEHLAASGVTKGCATDPARYCPDGSLSRGQMAAFLTRAFDIETGSPAAVVGNAAGTSAERIGNLVAANIAEPCGTALDQYCREEVVTRAQMATLLARTLRLVPGAQFAGEVGERNIRHLVSRYTTYYSCCSARVTNIQLFADRIDGALVAPGRSFSLNRHVGRRTVEKGFLAAGTLVGGELVDTVGGGVSQFATTFYNAMFWGGYRDVTHRPHSRYFTRYPEGIEATVNWPDIDLVFRNNTSGYVLITTHHTDTSLTVDFYGDNDGRIVVGEWKNGRGSSMVVSEGGSGARVVTASVSDRYEHKDPPRPLYRGNPELAHDRRKHVRTATQGWTVRVTRTIIRGGNKTIRSWTVRYVPRRSIIEVHPCVLSDSCSDPAEPPDNVEPPENVQPPPGGGGQFIRAGEPERS